MKKRLVFFLFFSVLIGTFLWFSYESQRGKNKRSPLLAEIIPIHSFSDHSIPLIQVQIEDEPILVKFDLGSHTCLSVPSESFEKIKNKTYLKSVLSCSIKGVMKNREIYSIPNIEMNNLIFRNIELSKINPEFEQEIIINKTPSKFTSSIGRAGWNLFSSISLLIDFQNARLGVFDSFDTLLQHGHFPKSYIKTPLLLDRGFIEIEGFTTSSLRFVLDTGATWNFIRTDPITPDLSVNLDDVHQQVTVKIKDINFPLTFYPLSIQSPFSFDAILGVEFFKNHPVFLDFKNKCVYIGL